MSEIIELNGQWGKVAIPVKKITGITETNGTGGYKVFIATGADSVDGGENGWYVKDEYQDVKAKLELALIGMSNARNSVWNPPTTENDLER